MLLNQVRELVTPYLQDEMLELGYSEFSVEDKNIAVDIECEHFVDYETLLRGTVLIIRPKKVSVFVCDKEGNYGEPVDMTREFSDYKYRVFN